MDGVGDYRRQSGSRSGQSGSGRQSGSSGNRPLLTGQARARTIARRQRRRRQRRIIIGVMVLLLVVIVLAAGLGISSHNKRKKQQAWITEGTEYLDQGNYDGAIQAFNEALDIFKGKTGKTELMVLQYRAEAEYVKKDYTAALATCESLVAADGKKDAYLRLQSLCQMQLGNYEAALSYGQNAALIYNRIAFQAIEEARYEAALAAIDQGIAAADPLVMAELAYHQAVAYEKMGDFAKALELFEAYDQSYGPDPKAEVEIAFLKTRQGE